MVEENGRTFAVVANHEEQYSIWPDGRDLPRGWVAVGPVGPKEDCLDYIEHVWTDMRPRSLRVQDRTDASTPVPEEIGDELQARVREVLSQHDDQVEQYVDGSPELFGWFLARVVDSTEEGEFHPDAVRTALSRQLPEVP